MVRVSKVVVGRTSPSAGNSHLYLPRDAPSQKMERQDEDQRNFELAIHLLRRLGLSFTIDSGNPDPFRRYRIVVNLRQDSIGPIGTICIQCLGRVRDGSFCKTLYIPSGKHLQHTSIDSLEQYLVPFLQASEHKRQRTSQAQDGANAIRGRRPHGGGRERRAPH